jgi:hypothetical protein
MHTTEGNEFNGRIQKAPITFKTKRFPPNLKAYLNKKCNYHVSQKGKRYLAI